MVVKKIARMATKFRPLLLRKLRFVNVRIICVLLLHILNCFEAAVLHNLTILNPNAAVCLFCNFGVVRNHDDCLMVGLACDF